MSNMQGKQKGIAAQQQKPNLRRTWSHDGVTVAFLSSVLITLSLNAVGYIYIISLLLTKVFVCRYLYFVSVLKDLQEYSKTCMRSVILQSVTIS